MAVSGHSWYRITAINGKSVKSLYGVTYLYAAVGLFKTYVPPPVTKYAACRANLRSSASTGATSRTVINTDTKVLVVTQVTGSSYSTTCSGKAVSGKSWYRISSVNGKSVKSLYGVTYLYSATGLYKSTVTTTRPAAPHPPPPSPRRGHRADVIRGTKVLVVTQVPGRPIRRPAPARPFGQELVSISAVNGKSVKSVYGVLPLLATGLYKSTVTRPGADPPRPAGPDSDPDADALVALHRRDRHQPLAGNDQLDQGGGGRQAVRVHEGQRKHRLRR